MYYVFIEDNDIEEVQSTATCQSKPAGKDIEFIVCNIAIFAYKFLL